MTSPDFKAYVDLTINDLQPEDIYNLAKEYAILALPEFNPRTGSVEDAVLQAACYVAGLVTGAINRMPNALVEGLMSLLGFQRREATFSTGSVIFTVIDDVGITIPGGTQLAYNEVRDNTTIVHLFETAVPVTVDAGDTVSSPVPIVALEAGTKPVIASGEYLTILTPIGRLFDAEFYGALSQGADTESDSSFFNRASTYFLSLSAALATATQTTSYVLTNYPDAYRVQAYDLKRLPVFKPSIFGYKGSSGFLSIYPQPLNSSYKVLELDSSVTDSFYKENYLSVSSAPVVDNATVIRIFDSSEPDYDGVFSVDTGSKVNNVTRLTYPVSGTERKVFCTVRAASTANIASLSGVTALMDGVQLIAGDLVLVKNQNTASQNGIYLTSSSAWTRITELADADVIDGEIYVSIEEGTSNGGECWKTTNTGSVTIGTTALTFAQDTAFSFLPKVEILDSISNIAGTVEDTLGSVTIFMSDSTGASLTAEQKAIVAEDVASRSIAGLSVYVSDVIIANITVSVSIGVIDGYSELDVKNAVVNYINAALSPTSFPFAPLIRKNALIANISRIAGVDYVNDLAFAVEADSQSIATVSVTDDLVFSFVGVIPSTVATVAVL